MSETNNINERIEQFQNKQAGVAHEVKGVLMRDPDFLYGVESIEVTNERAGIIKLTPTDNRLERPSLLPNGFEVLREAGFRVRTAAIKRDGGLELGFERQE